MTKVALILINNFSLLPEEYKKTSFISGGTAYPHGCDKPVEVKPHYHTHPDRDKIRKFIEADRNNKIPGVEVIWPKDSEHVQNAA